MIDLLKNPMFLAALEISSDSVVIVRVPGPEVVYANASFVEQANAARQTVDQLAGAALQLADAPATMHPTLGPITLRSRRVEYQGESFRILSLRPAVAEASSPEPALDPVTRLLDRRALEDELASRFSKPGRPFALLFVDLDGFKQVNDQMGHLAGDKTLRLVAQRFRDALRDDDLIARFGGDEFVILAAGLTREEDLEPLFARLSGALADLPAEDGAPSVSASIGAALSTDGYPTPEAMLHAADRRMYAQKRVAPQSR